MSEEMFFDAIERGSLSTAWSLLDDLGSVRVGYDWAEHYEPELHTAGIIVDTSDTEWVTLSVDS